MAAGDFAGSAEVNQVMRGSSSTVICFDTLLGPTEISTVYAPGSTSGPPTTGGSPPAAANLAAAASSCGVGGTMRSARRFQITRFNPASIEAGLIDATNFPEASRTEILTSLASGFAFTQKSMIAPFGGFAPTNTSCASKSRLRAMRHIVAGGAEQAARARTA